MRALISVVLAAAVCMAAIVPGRADAVPGTESEPHAEKHAGPDEGHRHALSGLFAAVDMLFENDINHGRNSESAITENGFHIRAVEIGYAAPVTSTIRGAVNLAVHEEENEYIVELHEAYLDIALPAHLSAKLGRFLIDTGTLNAIHRHGWDFTTAPLVHRVLFDDEGIFDQGGELSLRTPLPFYQVLKAGFFNGRTWGHEETEGPVKPGPLYTGRLINRFTVGGPLTASLGGSYLRYMLDEDGRDVDHTAGADLVLQWGTGESKRFTLAGEYWFRYEERPDAANNRKHGFYSYAQLHFFGSWMIGFRYDYYAELETRLAGDTASRRSDGQSGWVTWRPSDALYFRLTGERRNHFEDGEAAWAAYLQADFHLGAHPHCE